MALENPRAVIGDNGIGGETAKQLVAFYERIERLEEEKAGIAGDIKDVFSEAKGNGFDTAVMRTVLRRRKMDAEARQNFDSMVELYEGVFA